MAGNMDDVIRRLTIESRTTGVKETADALQKVATAQEGVTVASEKTERATQSMERRLESIQRRYDANYRAQQDQAKLERDLERARAAGLLTSERQSELLALAAQRLNQTSTATATAAQSTEKFATQTGLARHEMINLSRQVQDVGVSLASGQSPFTVLVQQGTQIADVFAASRGTVRGFFQQIGESMAAILTPARVATGAIAGLGIAAVAIVSSFQSAQAGIDRALAGIASASLATAGDINKIADNTNSLWGLTAASAREAAITFAATGRIYRDNLEPLVALTDQFAKAQGISASAAAEKLAKAFADPVRGANELNAVYGVISRSTLDYIRNLDELGNRTAAQRVLIDELTPAIQRQAENVSILSKAWTGLLNALKQAYVDIPAQAISQLFNIDPNTTQQLRAAEAELGRFQELLTRFPDRPVLEQMQALADRVQQLRDRLKVEEIQAWSSALNMVADGARKVADEMLKENAAIERAANSFNNLFLISQRPDFIIVLEKMGLSAKQFEEALQRAAGAYMTLLTPAQRLEAQFDLLLQSTEVRTQQERIELVVMQKAVELAGQRLTPEQHALELIRARTIAEAQATQQINQAYMSTAAALKFQIQQQEFENLLIGRSKTEVIALRTEWEALAQIRRAAIEAGKGEEEILAILEKEKEALGPLISQLTSLRDEERRHKSVIEEKQAAASRASARRQHELQVEEDQLRELIQLEREMANAFKSATGDFAVGGTSQFKKGGYTSTLAPFPILGTTALNSVVQQSLQRSGGSLEAAIGALEGTAQSAERDRLIKQLTEQLQAQTAATQGNTSATNSLSATISSVLSPFYAQDPRTSHLGFRAELGVYPLNPFASLPNTSTGVATQQINGQTQYLLPGMADGGSFSVPGGYSPVDSMMAHIPIASGETIDVTPKNRRRGGDMSITINAPITVQGNADADALGRTIFQNFQDIGRQLDQQYR